MINLTNVKGCYSRELKRKHSKILKAAVNEKITPTEMKEIIGKVVRKAYINKVAKPRFLKTLNKMKSKKTIMTYVDRVIAAGTYYRPENRKYN